MAREGPTLEPDFTTFDFEDYDDELAAERDWIRKQQAQARECKSGDLVGGVATWPRGDGYAYYLVISQRPLTLSLLALGDAWTVEDALIRGLTVADVRERVQHTQRFGFP